MKDLIGDELSIVLTLDGRGIREKARVLHALLSQVPREELLQRVQQIAWPGGDAG